MPKTRISCPNCRQPVVADIDQILDVGADPSAKQRLLSGAYNLIQCPNCGYQGNISSPIIYHDPDKELLLTFVPPELGLPRDEQERLIGGLINQVVNRLPQEKRKGYLLRPQSTLTMQGLIERVLEGEGITREMMQAQQQRMNLIQRLLSVSPESRPEIAKAEDALIDANFFNLLRRLADASMMGGDQESAQQLAALQESLIPITTFGQELQAQSREVEAAVKELQAAGRGLTREKLLDLVVSAPNETRVQAYASLARPVMDYEFFGLLTGRIESAKGGERTRLEGLREDLLALTAEIDRQVAAQQKASQQLLESILSAEDISEATLQNLPGIDDFFLQSLNAAMEAARKTGNLERIGKLQKIVDVLQQVSSSPPEVALIEELLEAPDDESRMKLMQEHKDEITPDFLSALSNIVVQVQQGEDKELAERMMAVNRAALRFSMQANLK